MCIEFQKKKYTGHQDRFNLQINNATKKFLQRHIEQRHLFGNAHRAGRKEKESGGGGGCVAEVGEVEEGQKKGGEVWGSQDKGERDVWREEGEARERRTRQAGDSRKVSGGGGEEGGGARCDGGRGGGVLWHTQVTKHSPRYAPA